MNESFKSPHVSFLRSSSPQGVLLSAALVAVIVGCFAGWSAWREERSRSVPMDVDGWGVLIQRLKCPNADFTVLFTNPPLWKGPVVPFVFGLCYYVAPFDESVLIFNVIAFALAAGLLVIGFCSFGIDRFSAFLAALMGTCYWAHHYIFGYYYAEPFLVLLLSLILLLMRWTLSSDRRVAALLTGGVAGLALLARPPFLFLVAGIPVLLWWHSAQGLRQPRLVWFLLGLVLVFTPWSVRNLLVFHEFIPFTTEGGKILFQGAYLPGDDATINDIRKMPEYAELERCEGEDPIQQYRYWRALAIQRIRDDPVGQLRLCVRKTLRFWVYLPNYSWTPSWKTALIAACALPLAVLGGIFGRRLLIVQLCLWWVGSLWMFHAIVHSELRYNYPILPFLALLSVIGFRRLSSWVLPVKTLAAAE